MEENLRETIVLSLETCENKEEKEKEKERKENEFELMEMDDEKEEGGVKTTMEIIEENERKEEMEGVFWRTVRSSKKSAKDLVAWWTDRRFLVLFLMTISVGSTVPYIAAEFPVFIEDKVLKFSVLAFYGAVNAICSIFFGKYSDKLSSRFSFPSRSRPFSTRPSQMEI